MKKRILVISWFYPPINSSEGLVTFKLINNSKYEYDVFTQGSVEDWTYGSNVTYKNNDNVKVISSNANYIPFWVEEAVEYFKKNLPEENWLKIREEFIQQNGLKKDSTESEAASSSEPLEAMELLQGMEEISEDPLIVEAERLFGKDFVEVHDD